MEKVGAVTDPVIGKTFLPDWRSRGVAMGETAFDKH
jgi:hypothetical protein